MPSPASDPAAPPDLSKRGTAEAIARRWVGRFDIDRQRLASLARGSPPVPKLTREHPSLEGVRLEPPQPGEVILSLRKCRAPVPGLAHLPLQGDRWVSRSPIEEHKASDDRRTRNPAQRDDDG